MRISWWTGSPAASPSLAEARREAGFTLLEVLVAFAIMAVAMTALLQAFGGGLVAARRTDASSQSLAAARSLLERVGSELPVESGTRTGGDAGLRWEISVARRKSPLDQIKEPEPRFALFDVVVTVTASGAAPVSLITVRMAAVQ